jgi:hypothetical protein
MKRIAVAAALVALTLTSCASTWYSVRSVTATSPLNDNNAASCLLTPDLWPVSPGTLRMMHVRWAQSGSVVREDSLSTPAGQVATFPAISVPGASVVTVTAWASDLGGAGCPAVLSVTPVATKVPPAKPALSVAP